MPRALAGEAKSRSSVAWVHPSGLDGEGGFWPSAGPAPAQGLLHLTRVSIQRCVMNP